jgi:hypothetical protein
MCGQHLHKGASELQSLSIAWVKKYNHLQAHLGMIGALKEQD